jgi:lipoprotein-anchoring transpeptidase ErfK/SrfK
MTTSCTSGRLARLLALVLALAAVAGSTTTAASAKAKPTAGKAKQELVVLLTAHQARTAPSLRSASLGVVPARTPITDARTVLPVLGQRGTWLKVRLPGRPNSHTGWIKRGKTLASSTNWRLAVNTTRRLVTVYRSGRVVRTFEAVVGKPSTPTPTGQFFVEESIALRSFDVGAPFALALSARSSVLQEFDGGPGQIAFHGLDNVGGTPGTAESHGCVRLDDSAMRWLAARIVSGTPVTIIAP